MGLHLLAAGETNQQTPMWTTRDWAGVPLPLPSPLTSVGHYKSFMAFPLLIFIQKFLRPRAHFTSWVLWTCDPGALETEAGASPWALSQETTTTNFKKGWG